MRPFRNGHDQQLGKNPLAKIAIAVFKKQYS
jgi:hypothetical protein